MIEGLNIELGVGLVILYSIKCTQFGRQSIE